MSKFKKKFRNSFDEESEDFDDYIEQKSRKKLKSFERSLKTRNIDDLINADEEDYDY